MISYFASQGRNGGEVQDGDIIGRVRVSNGLFQVQGVGGNEQQQQQVLEHRAQESGMDESVAMDGENISDNTEESDTAQTNQVQGSQRIAAEDGLPHQAPEQIHQQAEQLPDQELGEQEQALAEDQQMSQGQQDEAEEDIRGEQISLAD